MSEMQWNALKAICSIYIPVRSAVKSAAWWEQHFGLTFAVPYNEAENQAILKLSEGQWLHFVETVEPINHQFINKAGYAMFRLTFEVRQIEMLYDSLKHNGVTVEELQDRGSCGINFVFYDLDGNKFDVNECINAHRTAEEVAQVKAHLFNLT